jgi:hypothetical protein
MNDPVMLFPNILQPAAALKTYAPAGVKFWENEATVLDGMKEFTDGWFARRRAGTLAALETARLMGEAATPIDALRSYQDWFSGAMTRLMEDGIACQHQIMKAGAGFGPTLPADQDSSEAQDSQPSEQRRSA